MMLMEGGYFSAKNEIEVGSMLKYLLEHPEDTGYYELSIVHFPPGGGKVEESLLIRLRDDLPHGQRVIDLGGERQLVRCITDQGRWLDVIIGNEDREYNFAVIYYSPPQDREV